MVDIRQAAESDISALYQLYDDIGQKDDGYFEALFEKDCVILLAVKNKKNVAFGILNFEPKYNLYKKLNIPEIQDLNVIPDARQQGIASAMIEAFETLARDQGAEQIGISVGLTKDYGPAQRLYYKLGYQPDGYGITYNREEVKVGGLYHADDDLCLMMVKIL
jgi:ribosomal protein S18 acetylase RimI-like enzyme